MGCVVRGLEEGVQSAPLGEGALVGISTSVSDVVGRLFYVTVCGNGVADVVDVWAWVLISIGLSERVSKYR